VVLLVDLCLGGRCYPQQHNLVAGDEAGISLTAYHTETNRCQSVLPVGSVSG
jgi:hypothetical protein